MKPWVQVEGGLRLAYDMDLHACVLLCGDELIHEDQGCDFIDTYGVQEQNELIRQAVQRFTKGWRDQ